VVYNLLFFFENNWPYGLDWPYGLTGWVEEVGIVYDNPFL
jgi:hypothetical protein